MSETTPSGPTVRSYPEVVEVEPAAAELDADVRPPGSKSLTNRALICAALADAPTTLDGVLFADDTAAMLQCLHDLGVGITVDRAGARVVVEPTAALGGDGALLDARMSGTTSRFVMPVAALGSGTIVLDGAPQLRVRPMADLIDALAALGASIAPLGESGFLPVTIEAGGLAGGTIEVAGDVSSQFLSGLLLAAPRMRDGLTVSVTTELVSVPYVQMTLATMAAFGAASTSEGLGEAAPPGDGSSVAGSTGTPPRRIRVEPGGYRSPGAYRIEPDASAASYFLAAAAIRGGRVRVEGLGTDSLQGDVAFADALELMGVHVERTATSLEVRGGGALHGVDVDFADISDTAQTLAVVAPFADSPTTITGIGFIRRKETDRIAATVAELRRCGIDAEELDDGLRIHPGTPRPATVQTYDDHRMAMSFALLGLRVPGIRIADPGCVAKTFPGYWDALEQLRRPGAPTSENAPA
jgi:3-phosphoshikimate 1-carboxyvinyltransferase